MPKSIQPEAVAIDGLAGVLEGMLEVPELPVRGIAVVCHPHPQHGGAMTNKVTHTLARAMNLRSHVALRFNFRGVGASEGDYAAGVGEVDDVLTAARWLQDRYPGQPLMLAGFSFGAAMALRAAATLSPTGLVLVAPPVGRILDTAEALPAQMPTVIVQGGQDDVVSPQAVLDWVNAQAAPLELIWLEEAGHFFHGALVEVRERLLAVLESQ